MSQEKIISQRSLKGSFFISESFKTGWKISSGKSNSSQFVMSSKKHRGSVYLPYVFTEEGVAMLSSVLKSETAIRVNIQIIRIFTRMREMIVNHKDILLQLEKIDLPAGRQERNLPGMMKTLPSYLDN